MRFREETLKYWMSMEIIIKVLKIVVKLYSKCNPICSEVHWLALLLIATCSDHLGLTLTFQKIVLSGSFDCKYQNGNEWV